MPRLTKKRAALRRTIENAVKRELRKMVVEGSEIERWEPDALASWVAPGVIRSVERALKATPRSKS